MALIVKLRNEGKNYDSQYRELVEARRMRQIYAVEASREIEKCSHDVQNFVK